MELTKKDKIIKYSVYCLVIAAAALLQNVSGLFPEVFRARCFLLIPVSVLLGLDEDEKNAALLGLFAGFLWDMVSAHHMGFNCIFLMFFCYLSSALVTFVFRNTFWLGFVQSAAVTVIYCLLYWLLFVLPTGRVGALGALGAFYIPCAVYTCAVTLILCLILNPLIRKLNKEEQPEK